MGALIGAAIVYLVTNIQVKEQRKIQLDSIREEHNNALKREMKQYHFHNQVEKIEEFYELIEETMDSVTKCTNDFTRYITYSHILYGGTDVYTKEEELIYKDEIKKLKTEFYEWIHIFTKASFKMSRLSLYVEDTSLHVNKFNKQLGDFISEIRSGYSDKNSFNNYMNNPNEPALSHQLDGFINLVTQFTINILEPKLAEKILEMNE
ncbi:hypothetical protein [Paenisporosarcina quisquiliarum]|uniref:hypothetical protein n=1 Tax=Paenisporosarcina quisquiliarum TaxID=365346 RepID=UPI003735DAD3